MNFAYYGSLRSQLNHPEDISHPQNSCLNLPSVSCSSRQDSSVCSAILCARHAACTSGTSRSTSSRECSNVTCATSSSRRQSSYWSTRSATPSPPEGSSKESKYRQRFLTLPIPPRLPDPLHPLHTNRHQQSVHESILGLCQLIGVTVWLQQQHLTYVQIHKTVRFRSIIS